MSGLNPTKAIATSLALGGLLLAALPSEASAAYCQARSAKGARGWARNYSLARAQYNALYQCARRTLRGVMCYIQYCSP
jgi:hypothetical protein